MQFRTILSASLVAAAASTAIAQPPKPAASAVAAQPAQQRPAQVVLASAEQVQSAPAAATDQPTTPVKHRAARVTSCRCGDQAAAETPDDQ